MVNYNIISELIVNILRVLLIKKMMELFLSVDDADEKKLQTGFIFYYLLTAAVYSILGVSVIYEVCNFLGIMGLTFLYEIGKYGNRGGMSARIKSRPIGLRIYNILGAQIDEFLHFDQGAWKKRIWVSLVIFSIDMACSLAVYFAFAQEYAMHPRAIQTLLLLICVTIVSHISYPADSREIAFDKRQTIF